MNKTLSVLIGLAVLASVSFIPIAALAETTPSTAYLNAQTYISQITSKTELNALIKLLKKQIKALKKSAKSKTSTSSSSTLQNLTIARISVDQPEGIGWASYGSVPDQKITVLVQNNSHASLTLTGEKAEYVISMYEINNGDKKKLGKWATGEFFIPYANGFSEFSAYVEGGLPFDGDDYEKEYQVEVEIDTGNDVDESNEKDNKAKSDAWEVTYYKG